MAVTSELADRIRSQPADDPNVAEIRMFGGICEMKGFIVVAQDALDGRALKSWIAMATTYVGALPPKASKQKKP